MTASIGHVVTRALAVGLVAAAASASHCPEAISFVGVTMDAAAGRVVEATSASDPSDTDGPGLRGTATSSLQLPVPRSFDLSHVDPAYFAVALARDPARIFEFVRDRIAFEPYAGALRGPRGTLMAMAGNSVDRASLVASLLVNSGHRVRYVHGTLPESAAKALVSSLWAERPSGVAAGLTEASPDVDDEVDALMDAVKRDATALVTTLKQAGRPGRRAPALTADDLIGEARDHYWVEWWHDGAWTTMDPSFATAVPGHAYAAAESTFDAIPERLYHRIGIRLTVEEYTGERPAVREVLQYAAKAADLSGVDLLLSHEAVRPDTANEVRPGPTVRQARIVGLTFWLKAEAAHANPAEGMLDALGGAGAESAAPTATAQFVELEFAGPDGRKEVLVREIFDRVGKGRRASGVTLTADRVVADEPDAAPGDVAGSVYDFLVTTGAVHTEHLRGISDEAPHTGDDVADVRAGLRRLGVAFTTISDALLGRISDTTHGTVRVYVETPRVYISEISTWKGTPRLSLDLRRDRTRVVVSGFQEERRFVAEVMRGVVNGTLERFVVDRLSRTGTEREPSETSVMSTSLVFERAREAKAHTVLLAGTNAGLRSDVPEDARARIDESLAAGQIVVAPDGPVAVGGVPRFAWWQIRSAVRCHHGGHRRRPPSGDRGRRRHPHQGRVGHHPHSSRRSYVSSHREQRDQGDEAREGRDAEFRQAGRRAPVAWAGRIVGSRDPVDV